MQIEIDGRLIEWDDNKAAINIQKHHLSFTTAAKVFLDEYRYTMIDELHSNDELRYKTIGRVGKVLVVIYTERGDATRIISARKANKDERSEYYYGQNIYLSRNGIDA